MNPPILSRPKSFPLLIALLLLLGLAGISSLAEIVPACGLRHWTGAPCPFCGGTRCLIELRNLRWREAFAHNPMVFVASMGVLAWGAASLVGHVFFRTAPTLDRIPKLRKILPSALLGAFVLNWLYLCWK